MLSNEQVSTIIKHQDYIAALCFDYFRNLGLHFVLFNMDITSLTKRIISDEEMLKQFRSDNLFCLLNVADQNEKKKIVSILEERQKNGENIYAGNFYEKELPFGRVIVDSYNISYNNNDQYAEYKEKLKEKILAITDPVLKEAILNSVVPTASNFFNLYEKGILNEDKLNFIKKIFEKNNNILRGFNFNLLIDDIYEIGEDFIELISNHRSLSSMLVVIHNNNEILFNACKYIFSNLQDKSLQTKSMIIEKVIMYSFNNLISLENEKEINPEFLLNYAIRNYYTYGLLPQDKIILENENDYDFLYYSAKDINEKKNIIFNKYFQLTTKEIKEMLNNIYTNINDIKEFDTENMKGVLDYISLIVNCESEDMIDGFYLEPQYQFTAFSMLEFINNVKKTYANTFGFVLRRTDGEIEEKKKIAYSTENESTFVPSRIIYDKYEEKNISVKTFSSNGVTIDRYLGKYVTVIPAPENFDFIITSTDTGFIEEKNLKDKSFIEAYNNINDTAVTKVSTVFINQDNIGITPCGENGVYYAYTTIPTDFINIMGNVDVNSNIRELSFSSSEKETFGSKSIADNIRQVYGELVINRTKPDYVVLFSDDSVAVVNAYRAASEWNIPIVFIDRKKIYKNQIENLDILIETLSSTGDIEILEELLSTYESNVSGYLLNRDASENDTSYTSNINHDEFNGILEYGNKMCELVSSIIEKEDDIMKINYIMTILKNEKSKYNKQSKSISKTSISYDVNTLIEMCETKLNNLMVIR